MQKKSTKYTIYLDVCVNMGVRARLKMGIVGYFL